MRYYIGIDPGKKGGLAMILDGEAVEYVRMPETVKGIEEWIDEVNYKAFSEESKITMIVERAQPFPGEGVSASFNYGRHFGTFETLAVCFNIPYHEVTAGTWKRSLGIPKGAPKAKSISLCEQLFPTAKLIFPSCRTKHDGVAEAILIAEWGRRKGL